MWSLGMSVSPLQLIMMPIRIWELIPWGFHWKFSGGPWMPQNCMQDLYMCTCIFRRKWNQFSPGSQSWTCNVKSTVEIPGNTLSVSSQCSDLNSWCFPTEDLSSVSGEVHLPSFLSFWALLGIEFHVVVSFLSAEAQCEQLFHSKNLWFECLTAKDHVYAATQRLPSTTSLK